MDLEHGDGTEKEGRQIGKGALHDRLATEGWADAPEAAPPASVPGKLQGSRSK
jgi:hypothetical protein